MGKPAGREVFLVWQRRIGVPPQDKQEQRAGDVGSLSTMPMAIVAYPPVFCLRESIERPLI